MPAFCIFICNRMNNPEKMKEYWGAVRPTLAPFSIKAHAMYREFEKVEGAMPIHSLAMIEFDSYENAKRWYHGAEYQRVSSLRHEAADYTVIIFDGGITPVDHRKL